MGLVKIILGTKSIPTTRNYSASGSQAADATGMKYTDSGTTTITASSSFDASCNPYNPSSGNYWYIVRGSTTNNTYQKYFKSITTVNNEWEYGNVSVNRGNYLGITVNSTKIKRLCYSFTAVFSCTNTSQSFILPVKGKIKMECWGASGGYGKVYSQATYSTKVGLGAYVAGEITSLPKGKNLYVYVGGAGGSVTVDNTAITTSYPSPPTGGWNGGGNGTHDTDASPDVAGAGGGATDIRLTGGDWNNFTSLKSRIIVAGGGGGTHYIVNSDDYGLPGQNGGAPNVTGNVSAMSYVWAPTVNQTTGYKFGKGENGVAGAHAGSGAGGGYYGGRSSAGCSSGGSSYLSGYPDCNAITEGSTESSISHSGSSVHYSGYQFSTNLVMYAGNTSMPATNGGTETGHSGNGYAKITMIAPDAD